jgi:hypothetical protein
VPTAGLTANIEQVALSDFKNPNKIEFSIANAVEGVLCAVTIDNMEVVYYYTNKGKKDRTCAEYADGLHMANKTVLTNEFRNSLVITSGAQIYCRAELLPWHA